MPILQSAEHDPLWICQSRDLTTESFWPEFPPPLTQVVDAALALFARLLPLQDSASAARLITFMIDSVKSPKYDKNIGRKAAVQVNAAIAILLAIRQAMVSPSKHVREVFGSTAVTTPLSSFLKVRSWNIRLLNSKRPLRMAWLMETRSCVLPVVKPWVVSQASLITSFWLH
jgi:hypothetical protein